MPNNEMQKTMEFILEQQAQFAVNFQRLQEEQLRDKPRLARLEDSFQLLVELAETTDTRLDETDSRVNTLEVNMVKLEASMATLAESQAHSDARLSALIDIVREDRNGRS
jgi:chromosome segregation ATPase